MIEDYKKNDNRLWMFRSKYSKLIIWILLILLVITIVLDKVFDIKIEI